jgi:hypothetical protein
VKRLFRVNGFKAAVSAKQAFFFERLYVVSAGRL